jgi:alpha-tubulin suppressor-like RCC1 family protein
LLVTLLGACESDQTDPTPAGGAASVVLTPATVTLFEVDSFPISATVLDSAGRVLKGRSITWESSDYYIANPQIPAGWVQVRLPGTATIRASVSPENVFGTTEVTVLDRPIASVVVTPDVDTIVVGGSIQLTAVPFGEEGQQLHVREPSWTVSDSTVVSISHETYGTFAHGIGSGTATIEASVGGKTGTGKLTVLVVEYNGLAVGRLQACGRSTAGRWFCWGPEYQPRASLETTLTFDTLAIAVGDVSANGVPNLVCGLIQDGTAYCWGYDDAGQVGDGPGAQANCHLQIGAGPDYSFLDIPCASIQPVAGNFKFRSLAVGGFTACGVTDGGTAYCWGANQYGQLGSAGTGERCTVLVDAIAPLMHEFPCATSPAAVEGGHTFTKIAAGLTSTCALTTEGAAYCWGDNTLGQLGDGTNLSSAVPVLVSGGLTFRNVAVSATGACGITLADRAYCWGGDRFGQIGDGLGSDLCGDGPEITRAPCRTTPTPVAGDLRFAMLSIADSHSCGVTTGGTGYCWGGRALGIPEGTPCELIQDPFSSSTYCSAPVAVSGGLAFSSIQVGRSTRPSGPMDDHTCGITVSDGVYCWGSIVVPYSAVPVKVIGQP